MGDLSSFPNIFADIISFLKLWSASSFCVLINLGVVTVRFAIFRKRKYGC